MTKQSVKFYGIGTIFKYMFGLLFLLILTQYGHNIYVIINHEARGGLRASHASVLNETFIIVNNLKFGRSNQNISNANVHTTKLNMLISWILHIFTRPTVPLPVCPNGPYIKGIILVFLHH